MIACTQDAATKCKDQSQCTWIHFEMLHQMPEKFNIKLPARCQAAPWQNEFSSFCREHVAQQKAK